MATILEQRRNLEKLNENAVISELFKALKDAEKLIIDLNKGQLKNNEDNQQVLFDNYAESTENNWRFVDPPLDPSYKVTGNKYNFEWSGEFLSGFNLSISGEEGTISSTGMSGEKQDFIEASNAIGLNDESLKIVIRKRLLPHLHKFARQTLKV